MSQIFASSRDFDVLPVSTQYGKCLETGDKSKHLKGCSVHESDFCLIKGFCCFPISIQYGKCLETGEKYGKRNAKIQIYMF